MIDARECCIIWLNMAKVTCKDISATIRQQSTSPMLLNFSLGYHNHKPVGASYTLILLISIHLCGEHDLDLPGNLQSKLLNKSEPGFLDICNRNSCSMNFLFKVEKQLSYSSWYHIPTECDAKIKLCLNKSLYLNAGPTN